MFGRNRPETSAGAVKSFTDLANDAGGDLVAALDMKIAVLEPEAKARLLMDLFRASPPAIRRAVLCDVLLDASAAALIRQQLTAEEQRPMHVNALIEEARRKRQLDLAAIPAETMVEISLYPRENAYLEKNPYELSRGRLGRKRKALTAQALGEGAFVSTTDMYHFHGYDSKQRTIRGGNAFTLNSRDADNQPSPIARFGALLIATQGDNTLFPHYEDEEQQTRFIGNISLDQQPAFFVPWID